MMQALDIRRRVLGDAHRDTLYSMNVLAGLYLAQHQYVKAGSLYAKALEESRRSLGDEHPLTLHDQLSLGRVRLALRKDGGAETTLREALKKFDKVDSGNWERFNCQSLLGASLARQKKFAEAEPLLLSGYEGMTRREEEIPAKDRSAVGDAGDRIVELYQNWGYPSKASEWRAKLARTGSAPRQ